MKILIIGGTQFIGPYIVENLINFGHEVTVFHRGKINNLQSNVNHIIGDRNQIFDYIDEFKKLSPNVVLDMIPYLEQHATDMINIFKGVTERIVALSSGDVYFAYDVIIKNELGPIDNDRVSEKSKLREKLYPYRNKGNVDYDKIPIEKLYLDNTAIAGTVLRLPVVYGPNDEQHRFFNFLKRMDDLRPYILLEEGFANFKWSHGYVEDIAQAVTLAVVNNTASGKVYNVGHQNTLSMSEWVSEIGKSSGWTGEIIKVPSEYLPEHLRYEDLNTKQNLEYDTSLIRNELCFKEVCSLSEGLVKTIQWERLNPKQYDVKNFNYEIEDEILKKMM
jgi:nucleoside-diphosphate-sugar epimerase